MKYLMGIDGGQTSLKCALADEHGNILGRSQGRGITHLAAAGAADTFQTALQEACSQAWVAAGKIRCPLEVMVMGLTGISSADSLEARQATELAGKVIEARKIAAVNDALIALKGAHAGGPGIIVISGTGTISLGQDDAGKIGQAGGWGWKLGDEGSGYWIGREGIRAALRVHERWGPPSLLEAIMQNHFGVENLIDIKRTVFSPGFGSREFSALASLVAAAAEEQDPAAVAIFENGGRELAYLAEGVFRQLNFFGRMTPVAPIGGAFNHFRLLQKSFEKALAGSILPLQAVQPRHSPLEGAVILAGELHAG